MNLDAYIALLQTADARISAQNARLLTDAIEDLRSYGQAIGHVQTGAMVGSMHRLGPFPIGNGALEASFQSGASYAEEEVGRGGDHDWATRTLSEDQSRVAQFAADVAAAAVSALVGQA